MRPKTGRGVAPILAVVGVLLLSSGVRLAAQDSTELVFAPVDIHARTATRAQLLSLLESLQERALVTEDSDLSEDIRIDMMWVSYRLREGDIWAGDVISLAVAGETTWTDNFTVSPNVTLVLDRVAPIPLNNLLFSELEGRLTEHLSKYLREPRVHAEALKRVAVLGGVGSPGFFSVSGSTVVSDLIMQAGGPSTGAKLDKVEFRRLGDKIGFDAGPIAFQAYSLDQLGIRSGDELHIPVQAVGRGNFWQNMRFALFGVTAIALTITRIF